MGPTRGEAARLAKAYYTPTSSVAYTGDVKKLADAVKLPVSTVRTWLRSQPPYTKYKSARKTFARNPVFVQGVNQQLDVDLVSVIPLAVFNSGYRYWLTAVDVLSKYARVVPIKDKGGATVARALKKILDKAKVARIRTDLGREFLNRHVQRLLSDKGVIHIRTYNSTKACVVERFHRTLRAKLWRYFDMANSQRYVEVLPKLVRGYNKTVHSSTKMKPAEVSSRNQHRAWNNLYGHLLEQRRLWRKKGKPLRTTDLRVGDLVRLSKAKHAFETGYVHQWTSEIFTVHEIIHPVRGLTDHFFRYKVRDEDGEVILGTFYRQELQQVHRDGRVVERILPKTKTRKHRQIIWRDIPVKSVESGNAVGNGTLSMK